ncbi:GntR family transcriptional regulator [Microbacterium saperdae]|uniref:GntR family transcriptional regulator n=1 Tax=Microbacterium saperdae TaxID=69368 RepID=A0A543BQY8_9MICO|nr:GntR family transcriptional regulator [Microbacterium saperdae]GGM41871.1 GntR family transcriptional regulator [Microbacterium saperdae]
MVAESGSRTPVADQMYEVLLSQFMDGIRGAGEPLNIGALSRELNVSPTPLREALARLEHTGLVHREALRGYRVAPMMSLTEVRQLRDARLLLEPHLAAEATARATDAFVDSLEETVRDFESTIDHADRETEGFRIYWRSDDRFHRLIAAHAGNPFLENAYTTLAGQIQRFRLFSKLGRTGAKWAAPEHRAILDAIRSRDADLATERMREHIEASAGRLLDP